MKIGIIGAGFVARAVATLAVENGHQAMLSNSRGPQTLTSYRSQVGCEIGTAEEAAAFGDIVLVAVPLSAYRAVPVAPLAGKIVLDANNYYPERDGRIAELDAGTTTSSELLAAHLPTSRIVKAFNAVRMNDLLADARPAGAPDRLALPLAGDDADARALVAGLYDAFGYDTVDMGPLAEGWRFERGRPGYCARMDKATLAHVLAANTRDSRAA
jgi:predicted dinucleotide-binding enzyme